MVLTYRNTNVSLIFFVEGYFSYLNNGFALKRLFTQPIFYLLYFLDALLFSVKLDSVIEHAMLVTI